MGNSTQQFFFCIIFTTKANTEGKTLVTGALFLAGGQAGGSWWFECLKWQCGQIGKGRADANLWQKSYFRNYCIFDKTIKNLFIFITKSNKFLKNFLQKVVKQKKSYMASCHLRHSNWAPSFRKQALSTVGVLPSVLALRNNMEWYRHCRCYSSKLILVHLSVTKS